MISDSASPLCYCFALGSRMNELENVGVPDEEDVDPKLAVTGEPIVGMEMVAWEEDKGPGALPA